MSGKFGFVKKINKNKIRKKMKNEENIFIFYIYSIKWNYFIKDMNKLLNNYGSMILFYLNFYFWIKISYIF